MFVHINDKIINTETINHLDCTKFIQHGFIRVTYLDEDTECVYGAEATDVIMRVCPAYLEGKKMKYVKHAWAVHNLLGHPLMQLLAWARLTKWGMRFHDLTVPSPKVISG